MEFAPAQGRDTLSDIRGVLWLDRSPLALRDLDFLYTGLEPAVLSASGGGHLAFRTADNGIIVVGSYDLRMPEFHLGTTGRAGAPVRSARGGEGAAEERTRPRPP